MIFEEYCSYILSRDRNNKEFTIPGSNVIIDKNEFLSTMPNYIRSADGKDYDSLLVNALLYYVRKDHFGKNCKFDRNMDTIFFKIRDKAVNIKNIYNSADRPVPFSYERVFEILVYYLRIITNILNTEKDQETHYVTAQISLESVLYFLNRKIKFENLDAEWEEKGWKAFYKDPKPSYTTKVDNYIKAILLATYIRYCEIMGINVEEQKWLV